MARRRNFVGNTAREQKRFDTMQGLLNLFAPSKSVTEGMETLAELTGVGKGTWSNIKYRIQTMTVRVRQKLEEAFDKLEREHTGDEIMLRSAREVRAGLGSLMSPEHESEWNKQHGLPAPAADAATSSALSVPAQSRSMAAPGASHVIGSLPMDANGEFMLRLGRNIVLVLLPGAAVNIRRAETEVVMSFPLEKGE